MRYVILAALAATTFLLASCTDQSNSPRSTNGEKSSGAAANAGGEHSAHVKNLDDATFAAATASGIAVVDFWATWCPPCRTQGPIIDDLAETAHTQATIAKVDVDKAKKLSQEYNIESIPTILVMKDGKILNRFVGVTTKETLLAAIEAAK